MVLIDGLPNAYYWQCQHCFRPLTGIMVLIFDEFVNNFVFYNCVSVPLRGLWFLSTGTDW